MTRKPRLIVTCALVLITAAAAFTGAARAQIMGDLPTITVYRGANVLEAYDVSGLMATKGVVQAQVSDRFALEVSAIIWDGTSVVGTTTPALLPLIADKDASIKQGSEVVLTGVAQAIDTALAGAAKAVLDGGKPLELEVSVSLVLQTESGAMHVLDTIRATTVISPRDA